jgi:hypothetical protein
MRHCEEAVADAAIQCKFYWIATPLAARDDNVLFSAGHPMRHCEEAVADAAIHRRRDWIATPLRGSR